MPLDRRDALKGLSLGAGGLLLSPVLSRLQAQAAGAKDLPRRFVFVVESNGFTPQQAAPVDYERKSRHQRPLGGSSEMVDFSLANHTLPPALQPLTPWKDKVTIVQGLSGKICGGGHSNNFMALGAFGRGRGGGENSAVLAETIDGALAKTIPGIFPFIGLGVSKRLENSVLYNVSAWEADKALPHMVKPDQAYAALFGSAAGGAAKQEFYAKNNLLDFLREDVRRAENKLAGPERAELGAYLETLEVLRDRQSKLNEIEHTLRQHGPVTNDKYTSEVETDRLDAQFDIGTAALICGLTNVMTISSGAGIRDFDICFTGLGLTKGKHHTGHGGSQNGMTWYEVSQMIRRFHFEQIAKMAKRLDAIAEGDGTMLDNTVIVYLSDGAEGHHSRCWEWPMVVLGNIGGKLKTGRYIDYPAYGYRGHRTTANMYVTLLQLAGSGRTSFGMPDPGLKDFDQHGPLAELLA
ncbi:MAG: DUF1552 domain-containing protein [Pirellulaceae bacterium]